MNDEIPAEGGVPAKDTHGGVRAEDRLPMGDALPGEVLEEEEPAQLYAEPCGPQAPRLRAGIATVITLVYVAVQIAVGVAAYIVVAALAVVQGKNIQDPEVVAEITQAMLAPAVILGFLISGSAMLLMARTSIANQIRDTSPSGAAWVPGDAPHVGVGLIVGLLVGFFSVGMSILVGPYLNEVTLSPLSQMAMTPGFQQILWTIFAIALAPLLEELLFRGVVYGGFHRSFGPGWAATVTSTVFVMLHISEIVRFWPGAVCLTGLAVSTLWLRVRTHAIGPAVAVHFAYNSVLAAGIAYTTI